MKASCFVDQYIRQ